eukprot:15365707-Ditylum_brightwellii.AAC.3
MDRQCFAKAVDTGLVPVEETVACVVCQASKIHLSDSCTWQSMPAMHTLYPSNLGRGRATYAFCSLAGLL